MPENPKIIARWTWPNGNEDSADVLNPGDWYGQCYMFAVPCGYDAFYYVVEADNDSSAYEEFTESEECFTRLGIDEADLPDYGILLGQECVDDTSATWTQHGYVDTEELQFSSIPKNLRYYGENLPPWGIAPKHYSDWTNAIDHGQRDGVASSKLRCCFDPRNIDEASRIAYALSFLTWCGNAKDRRACRLYLRLAGYPFV